jgi:hypothetical protein
MLKFELILVLLAVSGALQILARRRHIPHPVLLVIGGAALAITPALRRGAASGDRSRDQGAINDEVMRRLLRDADLETMLVEAASDDAPPSPYELE